MTERTTGATDAQIEAAAIRRFEASSALRNRGWDGVRGWFQDRQRGYIREWAQWLVPTDHQIVSRALFEQYETLRVAAKAWREAEAIEHGPPAVTEILGLIDAIDALPDEVPA